MKNFRIIATAALVFAVVGSALAFKAFNPANVYCNDSLNHCTVSMNFTDQITAGSTSTNPCLETTTAKHYGAFDNAHPCPVNTRTVYAPDLQ